MESRGDGVGSMADEGGRWEGERPSHTPKYLDQFLTVLLETFTTGIIFVRQLTQGPTTLCFDCNYTYS